MALNAFYTNDQNGAPVTQGTVVMWNTGSSAIAVKDVTVYLLYTNSDSPYAVTASCPSSSIPARPSGSDAGACEGFVRGAPSGLSAGRARARPACARAPAPPLAAHTLRGDLTRPRPHPFPLPLPPIRHPDLQLPGARHRLARRLGTRGLQRRQLPRALRDPCVHLPAAAAVRRRGLPLSGRYHHQPLDPRALAAAPAAAAAARPAPLRHPHAWVSPTAWVASWGCKGRAPACFEC
jgi:hypothetical protein